MRVLRKGTTMIKSKSLEDKTLCIEVYWDYNAPTDRETWMIAVTRFGLTVETVAELCCPSVTCSPDDNQTIRDYVSEMVSNLVGQSIDEDAIIIEGLYGCYYLLKI